MEEGGRGAREPLSPTAGTLIVPPFECAWLTTALPDGRGCVSFEVKGDNDVTVLLKPRPGSRRWQHAGGGGGGAPPGAAAAPGAPPAAGGDRSYTVILGSHRNSCLKFERDGEPCCAAADAPGARLAGAAAGFAKYWVAYDGAGGLSVGAGDPGPGAPAYRWTDPAPIPGVRFVGLSAWDTHVAYRAVAVRPHAEPGAGAGGERGRGPGARGGAAGAAAAAGAGPPRGPPPLLDAAAAALAAALCPTVACTVLEAAAALAGPPAVEALRAAAADCVAAHFEGLAAAEGDPGGLARLSAPALAQVLASRRLDCREGAVWAAAARWAGYGAEPRGPRDACRPAAELEAVLPLVRFPLLSDAALAAAAAHALCGRCPLLAELVAEAAEARAEGDGGCAPSPAGGDAAAALGATPPRAPPSPAGAAAGAAAPPPRGAASVRAGREVRQPTAREAAAAARFLPRAPPGCVELVHVHDGDRNGALWFLGTAGGARQWVNPVAAGRARVWASSPPCRSTDARGLVSGRLLRNNFAGPPRLPGGGAGADDAGGGGGDYAARAAWWALDLGAGARLVPTHYTLRADGSADFPASWALQGSADGAAWADLRRHAGDAALRLPGRYASWPLTGPASAAGFRCFRVLLTAPNPEAPNPHHLALSGIELYGHLYHPIGAAGGGAAP